MFFDGRFDAIARGGIGPCQGVWKVDDGVDLVAVVRDPASSREWA